MAGDGYEGVEDDQGGLVGDEDVAQGVEVLGQTEGLAPRRSGGRGSEEGLGRGFGQEQDACGVGASGEEAGEEGASGAIVGSDEQDEAIEAGSAAGERGATGDAGGEGEGQQGGATAGGGIQQGEGSAGDATGPEPVLRLGRDLGEAEHGGWLEGEQGRSL